MRVDSFRWISVLLSMVLGLGITRLLSSAVAVFRSRGYARLEWVPIAWAASIFIWQIQYWWAVIELAGMHETWLLVEFLALLGLALLLFVTAALILPPPPNWRRATVLPHPSSVMAAGHWYCSQHISGSCPQ